MNTATYSGMLSRLLYRLKLSTRLVSAKPVCKSFNSNLDQHLSAIQQIYVINKVGWRLCEAMDASIGWIFGIKLGRT